MYKVFLFIINYCYIFKNNGYDERTILRVKSNMEKRASRAKENAEN